jgi:hypothetical protein
MYMGIFITWQYFSGKSSKRRHSGKEQRDYFSKIGHGSPVPASSSATAAFDDQKFLEQAIADSKEQLKQEHARQDARQEELLRGIAGLIRPAPSAAPAAPTAPTAQAADFANMDREYDAVDSMLSKGRITEAKAALTRSQISQKYGLGV